MGKGSRDVDEAQPVWPARFCREFRGIMGAVAC